MYVQVPLCVCVCVCGCDLHVVCVCVCVCVCVQGGSAGVDIYVQHSEFNIISYFYNLAWVYPFIPEDLDLVSGSQVCQNHKLQIVF